MKKVFSIYCLTMILALSPIVCSAADEDKDLEVRPILNVWGGYTFTTDDDNPRSAYADILRLPSRAGTHQAAEWDDMESSLSGGFLYSNLFLPQRIHLEADVRSENDWFADFRHSYGDVFQARFMSNRFLHNLDNYTLYSYYDGNSNLIDARDNTNTDYSLRTEIDDVKLRFKTPDFPLHAYILGERVRKEGNMQEHFRSGQQGSTLNYRVSENRYIYQQTDEYTVAINSHLRWVEIELATKQRKFGPDSNKTLYDTYSVNASGALPAGLYFYPHSSIPELRSTTNSFKIHTTHTGRFFASGTLSHTYNSNEDSGVQNDKLLGYGDVIWQPRNDLSFVAKMRRLEVDTYIPFDYMTSVRGARLPLDPGARSTTDSLNLGANYSPLAWITLRPEYTRRVKDYNDETSTDWRLPSEITDNIYEMGLSARPCKTVRVRGKYQHKDTDVDDGVANNQIINKLPDDTDQGTLTVTWNPLSKLTAMFNGNISSEDGGNMRVIEEGSNPVPRLKSDLVYLRNVDIFREQYGISLSYLITPKLSATGSYAYMNMEMDRDIAFQPPTGGSPIDFVDKGFSMDQSAHTYGLGVTFTPIVPLTLKGGMEYSTGEGNYNMTLNNMLPPAGEPLTIGQVAYNDFTSMTWHAEGDYEFDNGFGMGVEFRYTNWEDDSFDNPVEGDFTVALVKVSKKFF